MAQPADGVQDGALPTPGSLAARLSEALSERKRAVEQDAPVQRTLRITSRPRRELSSSDPGTPISSQEIGGDASGTDDVSRESSRPLDRVTLSNLKITRTRAGSPSRPDSGLGRHGVTSDRIAPITAPASGAISSDCRLDEAGSVACEGVDDPIPAWVGPERRRGERTLEEAKGAGVSQVVSRVIPILDDLERAVNHVPSMLRGDPWVAGVLMIGDQLRAMLMSEGVERIVPEGDLFDPRFHEAIIRAHRDDLPEDTITHVLLPGYILNGRVLRAAHVQVAARKD